MRRSAGFAIFAVVLGARLASAAASHWPSFEGNSQNTRSNLAETMDSSGGMILKWSYAPAGSITWMSFACIANGKVFAVTAPLAGAIPAMILAMDINNGPGLPLAWSHPLSSISSFFPNALPAVTYAQGKVAAAVQMSGTKGVVQGFDSSSGTWLWGNTVPAGASPRAGNAMEATGQFIYTEQGKSPLRLRTVDITTGLPGACPLFTFAAKAWGGPPAHIGSWSPALDASGRVVISAGNTGWNASRLAQVDCLLLGPTSVPIAGSGLVPGYGFDPITTVVSGAQVNYTTEGYPPVARAFSGSTGSQIGAIIPSGSAGGQIGLIVRNVVAPGLAFVVACGTNGASIECWKLDPSTGFDPSGLPLWVVPCNGTLSPLAAEAHKFLYAVEYHTGRPLAIKFTDPVTGPGVQIPWNPGPPSSTLMEGPPNGQPTNVTALGESTVILTSFNEVRAWGPVAGPPPPPVVTSVPLPSCVPVGSQLMAMDSVFSPSAPYGLDDARIDGQGQGWGDAHVCLRYQAGNWICSTPTEPTTCPPAGVNINVGSISLTAQGAGVATGTDLCGIWAWPMASAAWSAPLALANPLLYPGFSGAAVSMIKGTSKGWSVDSDLFFYFDGTSWAPVSAAECGDFCCLTPPCPGGAVAMGSQNISFSRNDPNSGWAATSGHLAEFSNPGPGFAWRKLVVPPIPPTYDFTFLSGVCVNSKADKWACGALQTSSPPYEGLPLIVRSTGVGVSPTVLTLPVLPGGYGSPSMCPVLYDITFYEPDTILGMPARGVAVGSCVFPSPGTSPVIVYVTRNGGALGTDWVPAVLDLSPLLNVSVIKVRFVDSNTAYAIGWAVDPVTGNTVPLLIKIAL